jgi:hypothetical protein
MVYLDPAERTKVKNYAKKEKTNIAAVPHHSCI